MDVTWLDRSYVIDWILAAFWYLLSGAIKRYPVFQRDFTLDDPLISHKHRPNQVSSGMNHLISSGIPITVVIIVSLLKRSLFELHHGILAIFSSASLAHLVVVFLKNRVGRLRPDFLDRCKWDGTQCTGVESVVVDGHRSFPSGHSSTAWVGMTFLFLYFADKTGVFRSRPTFVARSWRSSVLLRTSLCISPLFFSTWVAVTRMEDYRHHKEDVIVGSLIGFISAFLIYKIYFSNPFTRIRTSTSTNANEPNDGIGTSGTTRDPESLERLEGEPRSVYSEHSIRSRDGFLELAQMPTSRGDPRNSRDFTGTRDARGARDNTVLSNDDRV